MIEWVLILFFHWGQGAGTTNISGWKSQLECTQAAEQIKNRSTFGKQFEAFCIAQNRKERQINEIK